MKTRSRRFAAVDALLIAMMVVPILCAIVLKILTSPATEGITITGAQIYFTVPMPIQDLPITSAQINSWLVMISILGLCLYLTHGISVRNGTRRQMLAEWIVEKTENMVKESMGDPFSGYAPFIAAIIAISAFSSLMSLFGLFPPTSDINISGGWAILVFILITYYKLKCGVGSYLKGFTEPIFVMTPLNILGEVATPVSMAFRHYGNVLSGSVISVLIASALQGLSSILLGWIPGAIGQFPLFQIGIPAVLSAYFDVFSGCMQAYIFAMLTMLNVSGAFDPDKYEERMQRKLAKKQAKAFVKANAEENN